MNKGKKVGKISKAVKIIDMVLIITMLSWTLSVLALIIIGELTMLKVALCISLLVAVVGFIRIVIYNRSVMNDIGKPYIDRE